MWEGDMAQMLNPHEEELIRKFMVHDRRLFFLRGLAGSPKLRQETVGHTCHFCDWVPGTAHQIPVSDHHPKMVHRLLIEKGAPKVCNVMSEGDLNGRDLDLNQAIEIAIDQVPWCAIISCIPGKLAFYQVEYPEECYILQR